MNLKDIQLIYDYNYWANERIFSAAAGLTPEQFAAPASFPFGGLRGTLVHILDAERNWRTRFEGLPYPGDLVEAEYPAAADLQARFRDEEKEMRRYLSGLSDAALPGPVTYDIDIPPGKRTRILWQCLYHVVNHGTQHRSEAAALLTDYGHSPGDLDFTSFLTETKRDPTAFE
jgi:uncharacterized damage-inducible protein DinB